MARPVDYNDGARYLSTCRLWLGVALVVVLSGALMAPTSQAATSKVRFRRVASGGVAAVAASGRWVFYISDRLVRDPSGQLHETGTTGTLVDEHTGRRQRLTPPDCPQLIAAMMGGPWLHVECWPSPPTGVPSPLLYNLANRTWTTVTLDASAANLCSQRWDLAGGCWVVGLGRSSIEFELGCYHCTNAYALQPIPSGPFKDTSAVHPGGHSAFDLNSQAGMQPLCRPLTYPAVTYEWSGKIQREPGWIEPLGRFALAADSPPTGGSYSAYAPAYLEPCGSKRRVKLPSPPASGFAANKRAVVWSFLNEIDGIRLPSLARFKIRPPAEVEYGGAYPLIALSATSVYAIDIKGRLLKAPLPRVRSQPLK